MFTRWLTVSLVAIGLGIAALELWASPTMTSPSSWGASAASLFTDAVGPGLPSGAGIDTTEAAASPRFTE